MYTAHDMGKSLATARVEIIKQDGHSPGTPGKVGNLRVVRENVFLHVVSYREYCS